MIAQNNYQTIKQIVDQLKSCNYECEAGVLNMNIAFQRLEQIANEDYQPKFHINETVYYGDAESYVFAIRAKPQSHPNCEVEYSLSMKSMRPCTTNESNTGWISENEIKSFQQHKESELKKAREILEKYS